MRKCSGQCGETSASGEFGNAHADDDVSNIERRSIMTEKRLEISGLISKIKKDPPREKSQLKGLNISIKNNPAFPLVIVLVIMMLIPMSMLFILKNRYSDKNRSMAEIEAVINDIDYTIKRKIERAYIYYSFYNEEDSLKYSGRERVNSDSKYFNLTEGDKVNIIYDKDDPYYNKLKSATNNDSTDFFMFIFPILILIPLLLLLMLSYMNKIKASGIIKKGILSEGKVLYVKNKQINLYHSLNYEIFLEINIDGKLKDIKVECENSWLVNQLEYGTILNVAYLKNKVDKAIILENYIR